MDPAPEGLDDGSGASGLARPRRQEPWASEEERGSGVTAIEDIERRYGGFFEELGELVGFKVKETPMFRIAGNRFARYHQAKGNKHALLHEYAVVLKNVI
ncbi:hypothetical protein HRbin01_01627 [archaeon HR01]|nr:hypothetical protein HRbin01_01627 [archaeon HR01]